MFKRILLRNYIAVVGMVVLLALAQVAYADSFVVNIPNNQGSYTAVTIQQSGSGYTGPQGEYYGRFPSVYQLEAMYAGGVSTAAAIDQTQVISVAPPDLPVYVQPPPPGPDYVWTPGYWAYDQSFEDYYWVPGTWVTPPMTGYVWTPGYWYWNSGHFVFSAGYWGTQVGFYGGVNYGYGYGGHWNNESTNISYNGGPGGTNAAPTSQEKTFMSERHLPPTVQQSSQMQEAHHNPSLRASFNHGRPAIAATAQPGVFKGNGIVTASQAGTFYNKTRPVESVPHSAAVHPQEQYTKAPQLSKTPSHVIKKPKPKIPQPKDNTQNKNTQGSS